MDPLDLQAGPELDTLIAERVMRWQRVPTPNARDWTMWEDGKGSLYVTAGSRGGWHPSTDANDTITVIEHLSRLGWELSLSRLTPPGPGGWIVRLMRGQHLVRSEGGTVMEAFCRCALVAARGT